MTETALGDDGGPGFLGERICAVTPVPSGFTGFTAQPGGCYDGNAANGETLTWAASTTSVEMQYESNGQANAGAALVSFSAPALGTVTWPTDNTKMTVGQTRKSNPTANGGYATITYLAPASVPSAGPSQDGGPNIRIGPAATQAFPPVRFRIDFFAF